MVAVLKEEEFGASEDVLAPYFRAVRAYPVLTEDEEHRLGIRVRQGDQLAIHTLVNHNLKLVLQEAWKWRYRVWLPFGDLIQEENIGLLYAAKRFDPKRGRFSTYATQWIRKFIREAVGRNAIMLSIEDMWEFGSTDIDSHFESWALLEDTWHEMCVVLDACKRACFSKRDLKIFELRYGFDGRGVKRYSGIASQFGITQGNAQIVVVHLWERMNRQGLHMNYKEFERKARYFEELLHVVGGYLA